MKTILLVDDSVMQLRMMQGILHEEYKVLMAPSAVEGLEVAIAKQPDLVLLDYDMPVVDGKIALKMFQNREETKDIPVVFLTGVNDKAHIEAVLRLLPAGYLLKPVDTDRLFEVIHEILGDGKKDEEEE